MINLKLSYIISHPLSYVNIPKKYSKRRTNVLTYYKSDDIDLLDAHSFLWTIKSEGFEAEKEGADIIKF